MKNIPFVSIVFFVSVLSLSGPVFGEQLEDSFGYKLALLHTRAMDPEKAMLEKVEPQRATISEFEWMLDALKGRCLNQEETIASTFVESWQEARRLGINISLLEISRKLTTNARDTKLYGRGKVNFRMTSNHWFVLNIINKNTLLKGRK